ncbi:hypothetical protein DFA_09229 [Cavenderia fasciculata]|uniref:Reverse transcriptase domain-containing protein n=1 Tax=Cavenderia fasciculata TaxID=261658 RepID=F4Q719_CACFS|nr:uncharacterized protein DFA_09229 [Cavenderia fasciculata]EGG16201.1 hypothetical protein DFA_09229 [Cavenderia fasciculata]|eukprot:XP_004354585.1 hypothetical protein DFA_09229 [Cavenderia fasciculata]
MSDCCFESKLLINNHLGHFKILGLIEKLFIVVIVMSGFSAEQKESLQKEFVALQSVMSATQQAKFDELHAVINRLVAQASAPSPVIAPAPVSGKRLKLGAPPPFNGDASSMRQWIAAVENQFNYYKTPNDERIPFARSFLTGPASSWFISVEASINSWDAFKSALKNRFSPVNAADVARAKLWKLSQDKLSIQEYTSTFDPATVATLAVPVPPVTCAQAGSRPISVTLLDHPIVHTTTSPSAHVTPSIPPPVSPVAPSIHVTPSISPPASPIAPSIVSPVSPPIVSTVIPPIVLSVTPPVTSPIIPSSPLAPPVPPPIHVVVQSVIPELSVSAIQRLFVDDDVDEFFIVKLYPSPSSNSGLAHVASVSSANPRFAKLLADYQDVLVDALPNYLADHRLHDMEIVEVDGAKPVYRRNNHLSSEENNVMFTTVEKGLASGRIAPSKSPYNSAVLFVRKKDGTLRMCVDFRALNKQTVADRFPLPRIDQLIEKIAKAKIFSKIDLKDGFNQIRIKDEHTHKTAFSTPSGHYEYTVIPFGLRNAPSAFVRAINAAFADILDTFVIIYIDDILIFSENENDHYEHIKQVLDRLRSNKLFANKAKSSFLVKEVEFLGHLITPGYIRPLADKLAAVKDWPTPSTVTELQSFLGLCNYYRNFIDHFADHAAPLYDATTKKTLSWSDSLSAAFGKIKSLLCECTSLFIPDMDGPFTVTTDASDFGIGAVLEQDGRPVAFESRKMTKAERDAVGTDDKILLMAKAVSIFMFLQTNYDIDSDTPAVNDFIDNRIMSWRHATQCLAEAQSSQKEYHDRGKVQESLNVGDMVLLNRKNITLAADSRRHSWKWYNKWIGPFKWTGLDNYNNRWSTRDQIPTHILDEFEQLNPEHAMHNSTNKKSPTDDSTTDILSNDTTLNLNSTPNGHVDSSDSNVTVNLVPSVFNTTQSPVITEAPDATPNPVLSKPLPPSILLRRILQKPVSPSATAKPPSPAPSITAKAHSPSLANTPASGKDFKRIAPKDAGKLEREARSKSGSMHASSLLHPRNGRCHQTIKTTLSPRPRWLALRGIQNTLTKNRTSTIGLLQLVDERPTIHQPRVQIWCHSLSNEKG